MGAQPVDLAYFLFALILAVLFFVSVLLLLITSCRMNHWVRRFGVIWIAANAGLFWLTAAILRWMGLSPQYATAMTMWSRILYAMLALYLLGYSVLQWRMMRESA